MGTRRFRPCQFCRAQSPDQPRHEGKYICGDHARMLRDQREEARLGEAYRQRQAERGVAQAGR